MKEKKGIIQRFWQSIVWNTDAKPEERNAGLQTYYDLMSSFQGASTESGEMVTVKKGSQVAFSCINVISQDVAKLPYNVRKDTKEGRKVVKNDNVYRLIHTRPNENTTAYNFWYQIIFNMLSFGNGYALIKRDAAQRPVELMPLHPDDVKVKIIEGTVYYEYNDILFSKDDILHYKLYSFDGVLGVSPIIYNSEAFGYALKQDKYKAKVLGSKPSGLISFSQELSPEQERDSRESWKKTTTGDNAGGTAVLSGGATYHPFTIPPNEGQMIEAAKLSDQHISGLYRVPPTLLQDYDRATFSNAEQQDLVYLKYTLTPILRMIEQETDSKLFPESNKKSSEPLYSHFNIKAMLRGDVKTQMEFYKFLRQNGLASANTILEMEDLPKLDGEQGDMILVQGAMIPIDILKDFYEGKSPVEGRTLIEKDQVLLDKAKILNDK